MSDQEKNELLVREPKAASFIKQFMGAQEFIRNEKRWCLWLVDASPSILKGLPELVKRVEAVRKFREASVAPSTRKFATTPALFRDRKLPATYLIIPSVSSENRRYIPIGFLTDDVVPSNLVFTIPNADLYLFGVMTSNMHMAWMRQVCGRLENRYRYSKDLVYNNFPFPVTPTPKQVATVEHKARQVLDVRATFPHESLASLYDPLTMPPVLVRAHQELDRAVDQCYRSTAFPTELSRLEFLFEQYQQLQSSLSLANSKRKNS